MKNLTILFLFVSLLTSCTYTSSGITDDMQEKLLSFEYETVGYYDSKGNDRELSDKIDQSISNEVLSVSCLVEEIGCPHFEGGYKIKGDTLKLYYQDINLQYVKCIDIFKLKYEIDITDLKYRNIEIVRLKAIQEGLHFID